MRINVNCHPKAKINQITLISPTYFKIKTTAPAINDQANYAIIVQLATYFKVKKSQIHLISGASSREKVFEIMAID